MQYEDTRSFAASMDRDDPLAKFRGEVQKALLKEFTAGASSIEEVDIDAASSAAARRLVPINSIRNDLSVRKP